MLIMLISTYSESSSEVTSAAKHKVVVYYTLQAI